MSPYHLATEFVVLSPDIIWHTAHIREQATLLFITPSDTKLAGPCSL